MKVEFLFDDLNGLELIISGEEFLKAKDNKPEFVSLVKATRAFCCLFNIEHCISPTEYKQIADKCKHNSSVIFVVKNDGNEFTNSDIWGEFRAFVSTQGHNERII